MPATGRITLRRLPRRRLLAAFAGTILLLVGAGAVVLAPVAGAEVVRQRGFVGVVDSYRGWFGDYGMGPLGSVWCIDHGTRAPDEAFGYVATEIADADPATRTAIAWLVGQHGWYPDRIDAAAIMLALHDLMGAVYPSGPLNVDRLSSDALSGFEGNEGAVLDRARLLKADAVTHRELRAPLRMVTEAEPVAPGAPGVLTVRVLDAAGAPIDGAPVLVEAVGAVLEPSPGQPRTDSDGAVSFAFTAGDGDHRFNAVGAAPALVPDAHRSSTATAQRVVRPSQVQLSAETSFTSAPPGRITVAKEGDATAYLPVAGARFEVQSADGADTAEPVAELVVADDGRSETAEVPAGPYVVVETAPPSGYEAGGPWEVDVPPGAEVVVRATNRAERGGASITKIDEESGEVVAGARLALAYDADADGAFETHAAEIITGAEPAQQPDLLPGDYELTELTAPDGYQALDQPVRFTVVPGETIEVRVANRATPPARAAPPATGAPPPGSAPPAAPPPTAPPTPPVAPPPDTPPPPPPPPPDTASPRAVPPPTAAPPVIDLPPVPPPADPSAPPPRAELPRTGAGTLGWGLIGTGLLLTGGGVLGGTGDRGRCRGAAQRPRDLSAREPSGTGGSRAETLGRFGHRRTTMRPTRGRRASAGR